MNAANNPRDARKKLLLLEAQLHRLEILQARHEIGAAARSGPINGRVSGLLSSVLRQRAGGVLAMLLPLLLREGKLGRWTRRAALVAGGAAAVFGMLGRGRQREGEPTTPPASDKKNPGRGRD